MPGGLLLYIALLENEWGILLQVSLLSLLLPILLHIFNYLDLFDLHRLLSDHLRMKSKHLSSFFGHDIVELACIVLTWEGEIARLYYMAEYVFAKLLFQTPLIALGEYLCESLRFIHQ